MAGIFLSYGRDDSAIARPVAAALEKAGHAVWWDKHIGGGTQYAKEIEQALDGADVVVVLWSLSSVDSAWVRDEAGSGRDRGRLVPLSIEATSPPLGFRQFQSIDLGRWQGRGKVPRLSEILAAIERQAKEPGIPAGAETASVWRARDGVRLNTWVIIGLVVGLLFIVLGLAISRPWERATPARLPVVSTAAADSSSGSKAMAQALYAKLSTLSGVGSETWQLVEPTAGRRANLVFQTASTWSDQEPKATVTLLDGRDRSVLWSRDFEQPAGKLADLKQQIAFTSAGVLGCTAEGLLAGQRLKRETLKTYLNACAQLEEIVTVDVEPVIPMLLAVTRAEPRFVPAWRKLLLSEAEAVGVTPNEGEPADPEALNRLRQHIQEAQKVQSGMSEVLLAQAALTPARAFTTAMGLIERAARQSPDDPSVLRYYSAALLRVGQDRQAVKLAQRAAELDPMSPSALSSYIQALAYTGRFEAAERELHTAERSWSGTTMLRDAQYRYHFRYGDPKLALAMEESDTAGGTPRLFLRTRIDPSPANVDAFLTKVHQTLEHMRKPSAGIAFTVLAQGAFGRTDELFPLLLNWPKQDDLAIISESYFRPELVKFRYDPRFLNIAKRAGLLDYWQKSGNWPDFCFRPDLPYDCKAEAAKLQ